MVDAEEPVGENNFEMQAEEIESLQYIFPEEMKITKEQPYQLEVVINSNTESEEKNFLKMVIVFDLGLSYPDSIPAFRLKNLSPDYMDNTFLDAVENKMRARGEELLGSYMIFEMCDLAKEQMQSVNDEVLDTLAKLQQADSVEEGLKGKVASKHMTFTPVNKETFAVWCEQYKQRIQSERTTMWTDHSDKPSGKELFEKNKQAFEDLSLAQEDLDES